MSNKNLFISLRHGQIPDNGKPDYFFKIFFCFFHTFVAVCFTHGRDTVFTGSVLGGEKERTKNIRCTSNDSVRKKTRKGQIDKGREGIRERTESKRMMT